MESPQKLLSILFLLLITIILAVVLFSGPAPEGKVNETVGTAPPENLTSPHEPGIWDLLNKSSVEEQCLIQARAYARSQQLPSAFVFSCSCQANETADVKDYGCQISAADGTYMVNARCVKVEERCVFMSIGGSYVYTFDDLRSMLLD